VASLTCLSANPQAHERLEETKLEAVRDNNLELVQEILRDLAQLAEQSSTAAELARILQEPHFQVPGCWGWKREWEEHAAGTGTGAGAGAGAGGRGEQEVELGWKETIGHRLIVAPLTTTFSVPPGDSRLSGLKDL
jgi:hypothetical protein